MPSTCRGWPGRAGNYLTQIYSDVLNRGPAAVRARSTPVATDAGAMLD
jgi:hypothetical protein